MTSERTTTVRAYQFFSPGQVALSGRTALERATIEGALSAIPDEVAAIDAALALARRGDLVLVFGDVPARSWKQIIYFKGAQPQEDSPPVAVSPSGTASAPSSLGDINALLGTTTLIQDERGVRLPRETED